MLLLLLLTSEVSGKTGVPLLPGSVVGTIRATPSSVGDKVYYRLGLDAAGKFDIVQVNGTITSSAVFDYEVSKYFISLLCCCCCFSKKNAWCIKLKELVLMA